MLDDRHDLVAVGSALAWHPTVSADLLRVVEESDGDLSLGMLRDSLVRCEARLWLVSLAGRYAGLVVEERVGSRLNLIAVRLRYTGLLESVLAFFGRLAAESGLGLCCSSRRPGMGRLLAPLGWKPRFVEYVAP